MYLGCDWVDCLNHDASDEMMTMIRSRFHHGNHDNQTHHGSDSIVYNLDAPDEIMTMIRSRFHHDHHENQTHHGSDNKQIKRRSTMTKISTKTIFINILLIVISAAPSIAKIHCKDNNTDIFAPSECIYTEENSTKRSTKRISAYNGHITLDTTWDKDFIINGDVLVDEGATLTICKGVSLLFLRIDANDDNKGDINFIVNGKLIVNGANENHVTFKSYEDSPSSYAWNGVVIDSGNSDLNYVNILNAINGIEIKNSSNVNIENSNISNSDNCGILVNSSELFLSNSLISNNGEQGVHNNTGQLVINKSNIINNNSDGIYNTEGKLEIYDSEILDNSSCGIYSKNDYECKIQRCILNNNHTGLNIYNSNLELIGCSLSSNRNIGMNITKNSTVNINNCLIANNSSHGIHTYSSYPTLSINLSINNSLIKENMGTGIYLDTKTNFTCKYSSIKENNAYGIRLEGSNNIAIISHCDIMNNKNVGVYFYYKANGAVENCNIFNNSGFGLKIEKNSTPNIIFSNIYKNKGVITNDPNEYQLYILNEEGYNVNCQNNFWNQLTNFEDIIHQDVKGTIDYTCPAVEPYTTNALPVDLNQLQLSNYKSSQNSIFTLPLHLDNLTNDSVEGIFVTIQFDKTVINPISVTTTGGVLENISHTFEYNTQVNEKLNLAIAIHTEPFNSSGNIAFITFYVIGKPGSETDLNFIKAILNEKTATSFNGHFAVTNKNPEDPNGKPVLANISGIVRYFVSPENNPILNTTLTLFDTKTTNSNANGQYSLIYITSGNYTLTPSKTDELEGLSSSDASKILKHVVELISLSCHEQIAADVSLDGTISATDAAKLAKYVAHRAAGNYSKQLNDMNIDWRFIPQAIQSCDHWPPIAIASARDISLNADQTHMDFIGFRVGDVNGSWIERQSNDRTPSTRAIKNNTQEVDLTNGSSVDIPIVLTEKARIDGVDIAVTFDETVIDAHSATLKGGILKAYQLENVLEFNDVASLVAYGSETISGSGQVASFHFDISGEIGSSTELELKQFDCSDQPASGGFFVNGNITRKVRINVKGSKSNDQAIIIAGGGMENNCLWKTTEYLSNQFYRTLKTRKFTHDQIMYFSDHSDNYDLVGDGKDDIIVDNNEPTVQAIQKYIENLHAPLTPPKLDENTPLIIYMMDHGGFGIFKVNKGEYLKATDLDNWLDELQQKTGCQLILIVEACHSGTFIDDLTPTSGQQRILISSSNREDSQTDQQGMLSFSKFLFELLVQGNSIQKAFDHVVQTLSEYWLFAFQHPILIQNDQLLSAVNTYIGGTFITEDILPEIISTTESQTIDAGPFTIQAKVMAMEGIQAVWASIVSPITQRPETHEEFETPILDSQRLELQLSNGLNTYVNQYDFSYNGDYVIMLYVKDTWDNVSVKEICLTVENGLIFGDINSDKSLNLIDAILTLKKVSDINSDCDLDDVIYVLKSISGM